MADNIVTLNKQGVGFLNIFNDILASSSFDGCVSIFRFTDSIQTEDEQKNMN
jgi:hypothetical protein